MNRSLGCLAPTLVLAACGGNGGSTNVPQDVSGFVRVEQSSSSGLGTRERPLPLYLNSRIAVHFSAEVNPLSVTEDTVRMMKITPAGPQQVKLAQRRVTTRSVYLEPDWPVTRELDDGSYQLGQLYRLEVAGFPLTNTVESKDGVPVGERYFRFYKAVEEGSTDPGPLLPVGVPSDPFVAPVKIARMASDMRTVRVHFSLPPDPRTVSPKSFEFLLFGSRVPIVSTRILTVLRPRASSRGRIEFAHPSSTVELRLAEGFELLAESPFAVDLKPEDRPQDWVRDLRGRHLAEIGRWVVGTVSQGRSVELLRFDSEGVRQGGGTTVLREMTLTSTSPENLTFVPDGKRLEALARLEAGVGHLGVFRPTRSMSLEPRVPFPIDGGFRTTEDGRFEFSRIHIPEGVTVTVRSFGRYSPPVELVSTSDIRIDGELVLETPFSPVFDDTSEVESAYLRRVVKADFGCRLVAAGDITVQGTGRIRHVHAGEGRPLVLLSRSMSLHGPIPERSVLAREPGGSVPGGAVPVADSIAYRMHPGIPTGSWVTAEAWTPWARLPLDFTGESIQARVDGAGEQPVDVYLQTASPDPIDPSRPYLDPAGLSEPRKLPLKQPIEVTERVFVRFKLRAKVVGGKSVLPSVKALIVLGN